MSKKPKHLEQAQREIVNSIFYVDPRFIQHLKPMVSDWFKKMKPLPQFSRIFQDYNKRFFTLNLPSLSIFYSSKDTYSLSDITYLPMEDITEIRDKPHYALSNLGIEWKQAFGFTIYFASRYTILVAQTDEVYQSWLNYFEAIRFKQTGKSLLTRTRTPYFSATFGASIPTQLGTPPPLQLQKSASLPPDTDQPKNSSDGRDKPSPTLISNNRTLIEDDRADSPSLQRQVILIEAKKKDSDEQRTPPQESLTVQESTSSIPVDFGALNDEMLDPVNSSPVREDSQTQKQKNELSPRIQSLEDACRDQAKSLTTDSMALPRRLDQRRKAPAQKAQVPLPRMGKNITDIWGHYDHEGNEIVQPDVKYNNFASQTAEKVEKPRSEAQQSLFLRITDLENDQELNNSEFLIRFDEIESSRQFESQ